MNINNNIKNEIQSKEINNLKKFIVYIFLIIDIVRFLSSYFPFFPFFHLFSKNN